MGTLKRILKKIAYRMPSSYIVMFHHVTGNPGLIKSSCILDYEKFAAFIEAYASQCASIQDVVKRKKKNKIAVTFDDGLEDVFTVAYPLLKERGVPFTVFIVTEFLNTPGYITQEQLEILSADTLVTIGSHGLSHEIFPEMSSEKKKEELISSKKILEGITKRDVEFFAYSHGQYDAQTLKLVKCYKYAMSVKQLPLNVFTRSKHLLPRYNVDNSNYEKIKEFFDDKLKSIRGKN